MAAPDFPNSPTNGQQYTAPSGLVYTWDGAVWMTNANPQSDYWTDTGVALTPTTATRQVAVPGVAGKASFQAGARTIKQRIHAASNTDVGYLTMNATITAAETGWTQDDATKPSWIQAFYPTPGDYWSVGRLAPGQTGTTNLFVVAPAPNNVVLPSSGTSTTSARLVKPSTTGEQLFVTTNASLGTDNATWTQDDATKPSWVTILNSGSDLFRISRSPAGTPSPVALLTLDNTGNATHNVQTASVSDAALTMQYGTTVAKSRVCVSPTTTGGMSLRVNSGWGGTPDDTTLPQWAINFGATDNFALFRSPPGTTYSWTNVLMVDSTGTLTCTLAPTSVAVGQLGVAATTRYLAQNAFPASFLNATLNAWITVATTAGAALRGGYCQCFASVPGVIAVLGAVTSLAIYFGFMVDSTILAYHKYTITTGGAARLPVPGFSYWWHSSAGTHTFSFIVYQTSSSVLFQTEADGLGMFGAMEYA